MPITESVELDIGAALGAVDSLGAALTATVGSFADQLTAVEIPPLGLDVDSAAITGEIDAAVGAADTQITLIADADTGEANNQIHDLDDTIIPVVATADVSEAEAAIDDLSGKEVEVKVKADPGAKDELDAVSGSAAGLGAAAGAAQGSMSGLVGVLGDSVPEAAAAAAAITGVWTVTADLAHEGIAATAAEERLTLATKGQALAFQDLAQAGIEGVSSQRDLGEAYGASSAQIDAINAKQANLIGQTQGLTGAQRSQLEQNLSLISANAVAVGAQSDYASALDGSIKGLANYQRAGLAYGVTLSKQQVEEAQAKAGIDGTYASLDKVTKAYIVTQAAVDSLGPSLQTNVVEGMGQADTALKQIDAELENVKERFGANLVEPITSLKRDSLPILEGLTTAVGGIGAVLAPVGSFILKVFAPLGPVLSALGNILVLVGEGAGILADKFFELLGWVGGLLEKIPGVTAVLQPLNDAFQILVNGGDDSAKSAEEAQKQFLAMRAAIAGAGGDLKILNTGFADFITTVSAFKDAGGVTALSAMNVSLSDLKGLLLEGDKGFKEFIARGIEAGSIKGFQIDGVVKTADEIRGLKDNLSQYVGTGRLAADTGADLVSAFNHTLGPIQDNAQATLDLAKANGNLTDEQIATAKAAIETSGRFASQQAILEQLRATGVVTAQSLTETVDAAAKLGLSSQSFDVLALSIDSFRGKTADQLEGTATALGVSKDQFKSWTDAVAKDIDAVVSAAQSQLPKITDAFNYDDKPLVDPATITYQLQQQQKQVEDFGTNIARLQALNTGGQLDEVIKIIVEKGPIAGGALAQSILAGNVQTAIALDQQIKLTKETFDKETAQVKGFATEYESRSGQAGSDASTAFNIGFSKIADGTEESMVMANIKLIEGFIPIRDTLAAVSPELGKQITAGMIKGIESLNTDPALKEFVEQIINGAKNPLGINSPSKVFAEIGANVVEGFVQGLGAGGPGDAMAAQIASVLAEADRITTSAALTPQASLRPPGGYYAGGGASFTVGSVDVSLVFPNATRLPPQAELNTAARTAASEFTAELSQAIGAS